MALRSSRLAEMLKPVPVTHKQVRKQILQSWPVVQNAYANSCVKQENNMNNNNMEKWVYTISYTFNITWLNEYLSGFVSLCLLFKMLHQKRSQDYLKRGSKFSRTYSAQMQIHHLGKRSCVLQIVHSF